MIRYLHFMPIDSPVFNGVLIEMINDHIPNALNEHAFLLAGEKNFREMQGRYPNIRQAKLDRKSFLKAAEKGEHLILHSLFLSSRDIRHIPTDLFRRMTWCVWGHDLYRFPRTFNPFACWRNYRVSRKLRHLQAIAIGFKYDEFEIRRIVGDRVPIHPALYSSGYYKEDIDALLAIRPHTGNKRLEIMIGHCAFPDFNHIKHLDRLARYQGGGRNFRIHLFLSYGTEDYRNKVIAHAHKLFEEEQLCIQTDLLSWNEYILRLSEIDIAILDFERQAAFGNIILLSYLQKKLYLSPTGIMFRALQEEKIPVFDCNQVGEISFETFRKPAPQGPVPDFITSLLDKNGITDQWKTLFTKISE